MRLPWRFVDKNKMDELIGLSSLINFREITDKTVQTQLFNIRNILDVISGFKKQAKSEQVKNMGLDVNDMNKLKNYLNDYKNPLDKDTYYNLVHKLRSITKEMEEIESQSLAQDQQISYQEEQDNSTITENEDEDEEDIKVRQMIIKLMSSTKTYLSRDDRNFISKVLLKYIELKKEHNQ